MFFSEVEHLLSQVGCARSKFQYLKALQNLRLFYLDTNLRLDEFSALDLLDVTIEVCIHRITYHQSKRSLHPKAKSKGVAGNYRHNIPNS